MRNVLCSCVAYNKFCVANILLRRSDFEAEITVKDELGGWTPLSVLDCKIHAKNFKFINYTLCESPYPSLFKRVSATSCVDVFLRTDNLCSPSLWRKFKKGYKYLDTIIFTWTRYICVLSLLSLSFFFLYFVGDISCKFISFYSPIVNIVIILLIFIYPRKFWRISASIYFKSMLFSDRKAS